MGRSKSETILVAEDDPDDILLLQIALDEAPSAKQFHFVTDGEELMDYLRHRGNFQDGSRAPKPKIILLDLNLPKKDGRDALKEIKQDPSLRLIPVVVLTTSTDQADIRLTYQLGANGYIVKPNRLNDLVKAVKTVSAYWFETVELPNRNN